jgi:hypothetical protein
LEQVAEQVQQVQLVAHHHLVQPFHAQAVLVDQMDQLAHLEQQQFQQAQL